MFVAGTVLGLFGIYSVVAGQVPKPRYIPAILFSSVALIYVSALLVAL